jgi:uncharacterized protein
VLQRLPLLLGLAALALAVGLGSVAIAGGIRDRNRNDVLLVTGSAKRRIFSDYVIWDASVTSQRKTPQAALLELVAWSDRIRAFLRRAGARDAEVSLRPVATEPVYAAGSGAEEGENGRIVAYRLTRTFQVRSPRVRAVAKLVEQSAILLGQGVPLQGQAPQYVYTRLPQLRPKLLADATQDALNRARVLAESTGSELGTLRGVDVGAFQVTAPNSTEVSDYGVYDTTTREKDVTAVVNLTLALR